MNNSFTEFMNDVERYLKLKFRDVPEHELQETATYIANRASVMTCDMLLDRDKEWKRSLKRSNINVVTVYERPEDSETEAVG